MQKITDDYDNITFINCTNIQNDDNKIFFKYLFLSIPSSIILFSLISLLIYTLIKTLNLINEYGEIFIPNSSF